MVDLTRLELVLRREQRMAGRILSLHDSYGFIAGYSVRTGSDRSHETNGDVYFHDTDCRVPMEGLRIGDEVSFTLVPNPKKEGQYRALDISTTQFAPVPFTHFGAIYTADRRVAHVRAKQVSPDDVKKAEEQRPFGTVAE